jgi:Fe-S-cluster-containing dehydrogenase component/DMSO reductase anchor subunit
MHKGFIFDLNKCVACQACVVACQIENIDLDNIINDGQWKKQSSWRKISTTNELHYPDIPVFHFSMACNHCEEAPCLLNCPAQAFSRDPLFKTVQHQADSCIGCQYCLMVCPYDAPQYNPFKGIIEKCTLCVDRLAAGKKPACATSCPTSALDYQVLDKNAINPDGFDDFEIKPAINLKPLRQDNAPRQENVYKNFEKKELEQKLKLNTKAANALSSDWPLLVFSFFATLLVAGFYASFSKGLKIDPQLYLIFALLTAVLSLAHLGKKFRAWRAFFNIRHSWLSREIWAFSLFVPLSSFGLFYPSQNELGLIATILGLLTLVSVDKVYQQIPSRKDQKYHSANVLFFTVFLYVSILAGNPWMFFIILALKIYLYGSRKLEFKKQKKDIRHHLSLIRMGVGFLLPIFFFIYFGFETLNYALLISILIGEAIDRSEFYLELRDA